MNQGTFTGKDREQIAWYFTLLGRAVAETGELDVAIMATDEAFNEVPYPPAPAAPPPGVALSFDVFNRRAQGILNKALRASEKLGASFRRSLREVLDPADPVRSARALVKLVGDHRARLADLLGAASVAALLSGAREVADRLEVVPPLGADFPPPPPDLGPEGAQALLEKLRPLVSQDRERVVLALPARHQAYARAVLSVPLPPPTPAFEPAPPPGDAPEAPLFPAIEEGVRVLLEKNLVDRATYERLDDDARARAFYVAGIDARATLEKVRDALADAARRGADLGDFRKRVLDEAGPGTFLSEAHAEVVFRSTVQAQFSDGQMAVLRHPYVRSGFPYAAYDAIHDERARHDHLALETLGLDGTNVYRVDDPAFVRFRPPWAWNDRCSWMPLTVKQAAARGVKEAQEWLRSGREPDPPAFVAMPPFEVDPAFRRTLEALPLAVRFAMESDAEMLWHGVAP